MVIKIPPGWGADSLSVFLENTICNNLAAFVRLRPIWQHLASIDGQFELASQNLHGLQGEMTAAVVAPFLFRAHASYRAGAQLSTGGQLPESYMVLRGCLENSLYSFHIHFNPKDGEIWLRRDENEEAANRVREEFAIGRLLRELEKRDTKLGGIVRAHYEGTIRYGGHPNPYSILTQSAQKQNGNTVTHEQITLTGDSQPMRACLKITAEIGLCALHIFEHIFRERFRVLGISHKIRKLRDQSAMAVYKECPHTGPAEMAWS